MLAINFLCSSQILIRDSRKHGSEVSRSVFSEKVGTLARGSNTPSEVLAQASGATNGTFWIPSTKIK
jgi:hypothetical protein